MDGRMTRREVFGLGIAGALCATAGGAMPAGTALADEAGTTSVDVAAMTLDELVSLRAQINKEIDKRLRGSSPMIPSGQYLVGRDIMAGRYKFSVPSPSETGKSLRIAIYEAEGDSLSKQHVYIDEGESYVIVIEDDNVLELLYNTAVIEQAVVPFAPAGQ